MTHYEVLGVPEGASAEHIKDSYRLKMRQYHPDMFQGKPEWVALAEIEAKKINAAYEVLEDAGKRREYDFKLEYERKPKAAPAPPRPAAAPTAKPYVEHSRDYDYTPVKDWGKRHPLIAALGVLCIFWTILFIGAVGTGIAEAFKKTEPVQQGTYTCASGYKAVFSDTCVEPKAAEASPEAKPEVKPLPNPTLHASNAVTAAQRCESAGYSRLDTVCLSWVLVGSGNKIPAMTVLYARANGYTQAIKAKEDYCDALGNFGKSVHLGPKDIHQLDVGLDYCASVFVYSDDFDRCHVAYYEQPTAEPCSAEE
jgi:hypothetical protein